MVDFFEQFHFIRPLWFYALIPTFVIFIWLFIKKQKAANWSKICDQELLNYFLVENGKARSRFPVILLFISWLLTVFSLAGPSWEKINSPIYTNQDALVIILDLSLSMNAKDIKPSRLERAKHKISDLLRQRQEGQTALIVYAGDAHIVSPLTPDNNTILSFIPILDSSLMPIQGSNLSKVLTEAEKLFKNAGISQGEILLLTDGINVERKQQLDKIIKQINKAGYSLSVIGTGTEAGAPIPDQKNSGFIKDQKGNIVLSKLNTQSLKQLANIGGGNFHSITISDQDIQSILNKKQQHFKQKNQEKLQENKASQWQDQGALFVLLILPLALLMFRKGWIFSFLIILLPYPYQPAYSMQWDDLWLRADQQGKQSFASGQHELAAEQFNDPQWKASSFYKAGKYQQAIEQYSQSDTLDAKYNTANSLAKLKRFDEALQSYDEVLEKDPQHQDSIKNKKIIQDLLKEQEQKKQQQKQQDDNNSSDQNQENKDNKQNKDQNQQNNSEQKESNDSQDASEQEQDSQSKKESQQKQAEKEALDKHKEKMQQEEEKNKDKSEQKTQQELKPDQKQQDKPDEKQEPNESLYSKLSDEEQQSMDQYLNQIKDDPAYLLRNKFRLNSARAKQQDPNLNQSQVKQPW